MATPMRPPSGPDTPAPSTRIGKWFPGLILPLGAMLGVMGLRAWFVLDHPETSGDWWRSIVLVLHKDAPLLVALAGLLWLATRARSRWVAVPLRLAAAGLVLLCAIDVVMIKVMGTRLSWGRLLIFGPQPEIVVGFLRERFGTVRTLALLAGLLGGLAAIAFAPIRRHRGGDRLLLGVALAALLLALLPVDNDYVARWYRENLFSLNRANREGRRYSAAEEARWREAYARRFTTRTLTGPARRDNVILLVVESLSNYQSREFGGVHDWTPEIDALARRHTRYTRFHAGGYCTAEGLMYLLCGVNLWMPFAGTSGSEASPMQTPAGPTLPRVLQQAGYRTAFLTTGPLAFVGKGDWLEAIGFDYIEGNKHPFYRGWPRLTFQAAPDEALYRRTLQWMDAQKDGPWFATVETVTSHIPYVDPATGKPDTEASFRYADRWVGWFVRELEARGYFEHGVLIITGDHRAMTAVEPGEKEKLGEAYTALVPFVLIDRLRPPGERVDSLHKQADLVPSMEQWLGGPVDLGPYNASLFEPPRDNVALHRRGTELGLLDVFWPEGDGQIRLAGDDTAFIAQHNLSEERQQETLALIAVERLRAYRSTGRP